ncbi:MAG: Hpt domain-containing protein [Clostridia bacterium]|nr:Hpt domain-containing protein [Clostridia bacterium]
MTLRELYDAIGGDYDRAIAVLRIEKLMDKHIRRLPANPVFADLDAAGESMDPVRLFESAHAIKGVCSNLGLITLADVASEICDEFRDGAVRRLSDEQIKEKISEIDDGFNKAADAIREYDAAQ